MPREAVEHRRVSRYALTHTNPDTTRVAANAAIAFFWHMRAPTDWTSCDAPRLHRCSNGEGLR
jgi:hypothetical protein